MFSAGARGRSILQLGIIAFVAGAIALVVKAALFPFMSGDGDEPVYVYQARMLVQGHVTLPVATHGEFFHPWLFGQRGTRLFSQYQPGWPAVIAVAHALGNEQIALVIAAAAAAIATWFLAREFSPGSPLFAVALLLLSPIFIIHSGLYLSYLWTTALVVGAVAAALAGIRTRRAAPYVVSGVLFGIAQFTRPFDALIVAVPTVVFVGIVLLRDKRALGTAAICIGAGILPLLAVTAIYNAHVTGSPTKFALQAAEHLDTFGFGARKMAADQGAIDYTPHRAWIALHKNAGSSWRWAAGGGIGMLLAIAALWMQRRRGQTWLFFTLVLVFPAAYFFWWATVLAADGARSGLGPHYYVPAFVFIAVLGGSVLEKLWARSRPLVGLAFVAILVGTALSMTTFVSSAHDVTNVARAKRHALHAADLKNAVVVIRADPPAYTLVDWPFLVGNPALRGNVLYAIDRGARNADLEQQFPRRRLYQMLLRTEPGDELLHPSFVVEPVALQVGKRTTLPFTIEATGPQPVVTAYVAVDGQKVATTTLDRATRPGTRHDLNVILVAPDAPLPPSRPGTLVARVPHDGTVAIGAAFGPDENIDHADVFERRYYVSVQPDRLTVQSPGLHYHLFRINGDVWVRENVGPHLAEPG